MAAGLVRAGRMVGGRRRKKSSANAVGNGCPPPLCAMSGSLGLGCSEVFSSSEVLGCLVCFPLVRSTFKRPPVWHQVPGA